MATRSGSLGRARSEAAKLPAVSRRVGSSPPERKARPKRTPPTAPRGKPPAGRTPAVSSAVASAPAAGDAVDLKNYVSDELRKVLEEEEVSYNWRRRPKPVEQAPAASGSSQGRQNHGEVNNSKSSPPSRAAPAPAAYAASAPAAPPAARGAGYALAVKEGSTVGGVVASLQPCFCSKLEPSQLTPKIRLVSYDGGIAMLMAGPLCSSSTKTAPPPRWFLRWIQGRSSSKVFSLAAEDWLRAELGSMEPSPGAPRDVLHGVPPKALLAGLLGDPSLNLNGAVNGVHGLVEQFGSPNAACCKALHEVMAATDPLETMELLTSQVEVALGRLEPPRGCGPAELLQAALRRELLRCLWCAGSFEGHPGPGVFDDAWLLRQLPRSPEALLEEAAEEEMLRRENEFLDRYLVRLMKLKRSLSFLLETWQKVDHYEILGVSSSASDKELRNAYRKACLRLHPDKGGDKQQFQQLQDSYARILEERQHQAAAPERPPFMPGRPRGSQGPSLSIEAETSPPDPRWSSETAEVSQCITSFQRRAEEMRALLRDAAAAELHGDLATVETLATAQEAGEKLMELSQKIGELAPSLSEASMEVAESSLALAARHAAVPCALLLTDVALSMTLEASRLQLTGKSLLEVKRDTLGTLQTLQQNLSMAKILGSVDAETFKLSVGLVRKATSRILHSIKEVQKASDAALQRGRHCLVHASSVCRFAAGRGNDDGHDGHDGNGERPALACGEEAWDAASANSPPPAPAASAAASASPVPHPAAPPAAVPPQRQQRAQNQRLLRQLNSELKDLQRRGKAALKAQEVENPDADVSPFTGELLWLATDAVLQQEHFFLDPQLLKATVAQEFHFVEVCGLVDDLSVPCDFSAQLLRYAVLSNAQQVLQGLQEAKRRLLAQARSDAVRAVLEQHFELLSAAVVAAR